MVLVYQVTRNTVILIQSFCNLNLLDLEGSKTSHNCSSFESIPLSDVFQLAVVQIKV